MEYIEHITKQNDRWDLLGWHYYGDEFGYERIMDANPYISKFKPIESGIVIKIPIIKKEKFAINLPPWRRGKA